MVELCGNQFMYFFSTVLDRLLVTSETSWASP